MPVRERAQDRSRVVIAPPGRWPAIQIEELWRYREMLAILGLRDVKVRYKQTLLGVLWIVIQPLAMVGIFTVLFGLLLGPERLPTIPGVPYALSTLCGLLLWNLFAATVTQATSSLVDNRGLITRIYFPRLLVPAAPAIGALIDFGVSCTVFVGLVVFYSLAGDYGFQASRSLLALPCFVLLAVLFALALSFWLSALAAIYRDVRYLLPFALQLLFFVTPVVFAAGVVMPRMPDWAAALFALNPMLGAIEGVRWSLFEGASLAPFGLLGGTLVSLVTLVSGLFVFRRLEQTFADVV